MSGYASRDPRPLGEIAIIDQETIDAIAAQVPGGGLTIDQIKADTSIADAITKKHSNSTDHSNANDHAPGSDNQDISGKVDKVTNKSLVLDTEISKIHSSGSDNQDLSGKVDTNDARLSDARTPTTHTHSYEPVNANIQTHVTAAHAPATAQVNADITKSEIEAKLTGELTSHTHAGGGAGMNLLKTTANQTINAGAATFTNITGLTFPVVSGTDYAFYFYITFQSSATTTGWRAGVNCPTGALDFWATSEIIANGAAGVATHTERHNTVRDDMTLLTATVTQAVDLSIEIRGRYMCTQNGTFACRFANELAANTNVVVQRGSWGWWF